MCHLNSHFVILPCVFIPFVRNQLLIIQKDFPSVIDLCTGIHLIKTNKYLQFFFSLANRVEHFNLHSFFISTFFPEFSLKCTLKQWKIAFRTVEHQTNTCYCYKMQPFLYLGSS